MKEIVKQQIRQEEQPVLCPNCKETVGDCACMRNKCIKCGNPVGNITFTFCDDCWDLGESVSNITKENEKL